MISEEYRADAIDCSRHDDVPRASVYATLALSASFDALADALTAMLADQQRSLDLIRDHLLATHTKEDAVDQQD